MAETEMVEKVAKAIEDAELAWVKAHWGEKYYDESFAQVPAAVKARAAIEAMRTPTDAMKAAWQGPEPWDQDALEVWQAMIDAALSPPSKD